VANVGGHDRGVARFPPTRTAPREATAIIGEPMVQDELVAPPTTHDEPGVPPRAEYIIGVDLGQAAEHSGLCVLERTEELINGNDKPFRRFGCRGLKRWPLGTAYPAILGEIARWVETAPLRDCTLVLGATNVGRPIVEMFRQARRDRCQLSPPKIQFTKSSDRFQFLQSYAGSGLGLC
jgi:hypothetical protein